MPAEQTASEEPGVPYKFECHKSILHRNIGADGAWIGLNGYGKIILNFWTDSPPLPKTIMTKASSDGIRFIPTNQPEITMTTDAGTVRQYEVSVHLTVDAAKHISETLQSFIRIAEETQRKMQASK